MNTTAFWTEKAGQLEALRDSLRAQEWPADLKEDADNALGGLEDLENLCWERAERAESGVPDGWCPVCGEQNGTHKSGCEDGSQVL